MEVSEIPESPGVGSLVTADGAREFALKPGENTVGRADADVLLSHNTVSRKHAVITVEDGKVYLEDVGSTNGTTVAGRKLEPGEKAELTDGVEVVFGSQALIFRAHRASEQPVPVQSDAEVAVSMAEESEAEIPAASTEEVSEE
ncbi:MAG: FHA domain-containing protein, partial [Armatimonadota bacterium]